MRSRFLLTVLLFVGFIGCKNQQSKTTEATTPEYAVVTPAKLVESIADYQDAKIEMEGLISHVCRSGGKMMVVADDGTVITVYPKDTTEKYDASLARKIIKVYGTAANKLVEVQQASDHHAEDAENTEHAEGCEHEKADAKPIIIFTAEKYEVIRDVDAEE